MRVYNLPNGNDQLREDSRQRCRRRPCRRTTRHCRCSIAARLDRPATPPPPTPLRRPPSRPPPGGRGAPAGQRTSGLSAGRSAAGAAARAAAAAGTAADAAAGCDAAAAAG